MREFGRRLIWLFHRRRREADLNDELAFHLAAEADDRVADGTSEVEAMYAARRDLGNVTLVRENTRAAWGWVALEQFLQDLRYGLRGLRKSRAFTATALVSLVLGIEANTAIFSLLDALLLRWLPVRDPQQLVLFRIRPVGANAPSESFSYPIVRALADQKDIFTGVAGFSGWNFNVGLPGSTIRVPGAVVTGAYYETLGLNPVIGRLLAADDDRNGAPVMAVISYGYWERQYARSTDVAGRVITINGAPVTIVGVSPPGFVGANVGTVADITIAASSISIVNPEAAILLGPGNFWLRILARPKPTLSTSAATARLRVVWPRIAEQALSPNWPASRKASLTQARIELMQGGTGWTYLRARFEKPLIVLMAVVVLGLVIGCANVANLLLARATVRQREIAVRVAIGASRGRLIRQFLTESILLSMLSALLGIPTAYLTSAVLVRTLSTGSQPVILDLTPNWHVLAFTAAVACATGIFFGTVPALHASAIVPSGTLQENARIGRSRIFSPFVVLQVAISLMLLIGAGLFIRTLQNLEHIDPGFKREGVLIVDLEGRRTAVPPALLAELRRIPGVLSVSVSTHTPLSGSVWSEPAVPMGQPLPENDTAYFVGAGPGFFETLQIQLLTGRDFTERDSGHAPNVAVVNEAFARKYFPGADALGRYLSTMVRGWRASLEVVGVAKNVDLAGLRKAAPPTVYVPYYELSTRDPSGRDTGNFPSTIEVRALGTLSKISQAIRDALQPSLPNTPLDVQPLSAQVEATLAQERLVAFVAGVFGILALTLAFVGVYGLLAYRVARQTREVGIRMALGARPSEILRMVLTRAFGMTALGIILGLPIAIAASQWIKSMLFGLTSTDPETITGAAVMLFLATGVASYVPARRAASVDPMAALRHE